MQKDGLDPAATQGSDSQEVRSRVLSGLEGEAMSLVCVDEHRLLRDIGRLPKSRIPRVLLAVFDSDPRSATEPIENGRNNRGMPH